MQIAKATDWKIKNMPAEIKVLDYQRTFSASEFERIRCGLIPGAMEDKWFIYYGNDQLNIHRSWTGHQIYQINLRQAEDGSCAVVQTVANRKKEEYNHQGDDYDILLLDYLIDRFLLDKKVAFPTPGDSPGHKAIFQT